MELFKFQQYIKRGKIKKKYNQVINLQLKIKDR